MNLVLNYLFRTYNSSVANTDSLHINRYTKTHANIMAFARRDFLRRGIPHIKCASLFLTIGLLLKVVKKDRKSPSLLTEVGDNGAGSPDGLLDLTIGIQLGQSAPGTEVLSRVNHDNTDLTLSAQGADELLVLFVLAVLGKAAKTGGAAVEGLGTFMETLAESVMNEGLLEDLLQGVQDVHLGDFFFDLLGGDFNLFVRHGWNVGGWVLR
jgi:hypothetical protein